MMAVLDLATGRRTVQSVIFLLLLTFSSCALASDSPISDFKPRRYSPDLKVLDRAERKLVAVPAPDSAVSANAPVPSPSNPLPPSTSPDSEPALIAPSDNTPGPDLPPLLLSPAPSSAAPITSPASASKQSNVAVILGVMLGVLVFLLVSLSAAAYFKPEWLPCCRRRSGQLIEYERHVPT